jgi:hypothetical protein
MGFSKSFPKTSDKSVYPKWVEVFLTDAEEKQVEHESRDENVRLMKECIDDAWAIFRDKRLKNFQTNVIDTAIALFEKRASHLVWRKEALCKEKFDKLNKK